MRKWVNTFFNHYFKLRYHRIRRALERPKPTQELWFRHLINSAQWTEWGVKHHYKDIKTFEDYTQSVPLRRYEDFQPYIERMMYGEKDVLWNGQVRWFAKSSGTTGSKSKFIPVTSQNLKYCHKRGSWDSLVFYYLNRPDARQFECKNIMMGGSLQAFPGYPKTTTGDISAIMINSLPIVAHPFFAPNIETALLSDWEEKLDRISTYGASRDDVVTIGGVPTWTVVLLRKILELTGKANMLEVWPNFQGYIHGGVSFAPYQNQFKQFFPSDEVSYQEIYNATEGYFAAQHDFHKEGMALLLDNGVVYEFLPMSEWDNTNPVTVPIWEVELNKNYAMVISTNSGLWRYLPGDTVKFVSKNPYSIKVTGRTKQFINAFGEEVMVENADAALAMACRNTNVIVSEYTVAPIYLSNGNRGGHQWLIEFEVAPSNLKDFEEKLDQYLRMVNSDYEAKRYKDIALENLSIQILPNGTFLDWLKSKGKVGGQHKVPRMANNREYVEDILNFIGKGVN